MSQTISFEKVFPNLSSEELDRRLSSMPFHLATLLDPFHIDLGMHSTIGKDAFRAYLGSSFETRQRLLADVLHTVGIPAEVADAVGAVKRHLFVPAHYKELAYLNAWIPLGYFSAITMPGLVAIMLSQLRPKRNQQILEIGIGSGYHAACVSEFTNNSCQIYGMEINDRVSELGAKNVAAAGYRNIVTQNGSGLHAWSEGDKCFDCIYITAAFEQVPEPLLRQLAEGGTIQGPRPLTKEEFCEQVASSSTQTLSVDYNDYLKGEWRNSVCVSTWRKQARGLSEVARLLGVKFVLLYKDAADRNLPYPRTSPFSDEIMEYVQDGAC
jgi:protein-L-isoaspartate(D-aspartate) O-methyltransferase